MTKVSSWIRCPTNFVSVNVVFWESRFTFKVACLTGCGRLGVEPKDFLASPYANCIPSCIPSIVDQLYDNTKLYYANWTRESFTVAPFCSWSKKTKTRTKKSPGGRRWALHGRGGSPCQHRGPPPGCVFGSRAIPHWLYCVCVVSFLLRCLTVTLHSFPLRWTHG